MIVYPHAKFELYISSSLEVSYRQGKNLSVLSNKQKSNNFNAKVSLVSTKEINLFVRHC